MALGDPATTQKEWLLLCLFTTFPDAGSTRGLKIFLEDRHGLLITAL